MRTAPGQVTDSTVRPMTAAYPVGTTRSPGNPPQAPSGSLARIRTRMVMPASRPPQKPYATRSVRPPGYFLDLRGAAIHRALVTGRGSYVC